MIPVTTATNPFSDFMADWNMSHAENIWTHTQPLFSLVGFLN